MSMTCAAHANIQRTGRFHATDAGALRCAWPGSQIAFHFKGTAAHATIQDFARGEEGNFLAMLLDDNPPTPLALEPGRATYRLAENLSPGEHDIRLFKQTEASVGLLEIASFALPNGTLLPPPRKPARRIEFIGDSITCGYGNESSNPNETFKPSTENHYLSHGQLAARELGAEAHVVAWSGEGILRNAQGDVVHPLPTIVGQRLPPSPVPAWDYSIWIPHVVVINLGTNDFLTGIPDREAFIETYFQLLEKLERHYRSPHIFCCLGPMIAPEALATARSYLQELKTRMASIHLLEFDTLQPGELGADWHPNLAAHRRMAETLAKTLKQVLDW